MRPEDLRKKACFLINKLTLVQIHPSIYTKPGWKAISSGLVDITYSSLHFLLQHFVSFSSDTSSDRGLVSGGANFLTYWAKGGIKQVHPGIRDTTPPWDYATFSNFNIKQTNKNQHPPPSPPNKILWVSFFSDTNLTRIHTYNLKNNNNWNK